MTKENKKMKLMPRVLYGAVVIGGIGFFGGFLGPLIFMPSSNQGPLIGIFITGPIGFIVGGIGGFIYWLIYDKILVSKE